MNTSRSLLPLIERLNSASVACVGDLMIDHFIYGHVSRISPEAPIPILRVESQKSMLGGLGNVVRNLGALGCGIEVFSVAGEDTSGDEIVSLLGKIPRCASHLVREPGRITPVKVRYVAGTQQLLRADRETSNTISTGSAQIILAEFERAIVGCAVVILSDYAKGVLAGSLASEFISIAVSKGKRVIVDPKGSDFARYKHATLIKPNLKELGEATGLPVIGTMQQELAARRLIQDTEAEYILVTRGADGILLVPRDGKSLQLPALAREVFDVSGAGDTVAAALAAALGAGACVADAVSIANVAAGIVVAKTGTAVVDRSEIVHEIENRSAMLANDKVLRPDEAVERTELWRRMGLHIGFIFGCFERLSPEDLELVEKARQKCDRLIVAIKGDVALTDDGSAPAFPDQHARAYLLASTIFSDAVVICDDPTPDSLLLRLRPDVVSIAGTAEAELPWVAAWRHQHGDSIAPHVGSHLSVSLFPNV